MNHLLSTADLADALDRAEPVRVLDVRWRLDRPDGRAEYLAGHVPGATFVDLDAELAEHGAPSDGRHPVPTTRRLQAAVQRWGLRSGEPVVAYDDSSGVAAAWLWWLLRQYGVAVRVLDGGLRAWRDGGYPLDVADVTPEPGDLVLEKVRSDALTIDEAAAFPDTGILLDVRAAERYRGEVEPIDPVAGHIPGAVNLPFTWYFRDDGTLIGPEDLRAGFAQVGVTGAQAVAVYCGSGLTASHTALALAEAGIPARIYAGSWSQWSNTPGRPVATGTDLR